MKFERMTTKSQEAIRDAFDRASRAGNPEVVPEHMLLAIVDQEDGVGAPLLVKTGANLAIIKKGFVDKLGELPKVSGGAEPSLSRRGNALVQKAEDEAKQWKDEFLSVEHFLLAAARTDKEVQTVFDRAGLSLDKLVSALKEVRGSQRVTDKDPEAKFQALEKYTRDLTEAARKGKIDPVVGRDEEIRRTLQVLSRRTKNNPVLIGQPGVGKTAS